MSGRQLSPSRFPDNMLSIKFKFFKSEIHWNIAAGQDDDDDLYNSLQEQYIQLETEELVLVHRSEIFSDDECHRPSYKTLLSVALSSTDFPESEHPSIIWKILWVVKSAVCRVPILVDIYDVTCNVSDDDSDMVDEATRESMDAYNDRPIPTTKWAIENLEKVRISNDLDAMRHKSCVICMEGFGHDSGAAGVADHQVLGLPCSHVYHGDCIVQWLETSHLCRYAMPREH